MFFPEDLIILFVIDDRFSKTAHFSFFPNVPSASITALSFMKIIFFLHGLPDEIISDHERKF